MPFDPRKDLSGTIYIPDTSSLIENPDALDRLLTDGNTVVLLHQVIEELGRLQASRNKSDGVRAAARTVTRKILNHREEGQIHHHVERMFSRTGEAGTFRMTKSGGLLAWEPAGSTLAPYGESSGDNLIVAGARRVAQVVDGPEVVVISEDSNVLLKCDAVGLRAENLRYGKVEVTDPEDVYSGVVEVEVDDATIDAFMESEAPGQRALPYSRLPEAVTSRLLWNTGAVLKTADDRMVITRANPEAHALQDLRFAQYWDRKRHMYFARPILGLTPRDPYQVLAMEFLLDPDVQLVVLDGPAGSGKTRFMVAAALFQLVGQPTSVRFSGRALQQDTRFENGLVLLRPEQPSSPYELGYLPGDYEAKVSFWLEPFFQHMRSLGVQNEHDFAADLADRKKLHMLSTSMLRGLDIERSIVLVDELQNGDRHLAKTLMSRFCETSKVLLAGSLDPVQIDNPYVDWRSNALMRVKQTYRGFGPYVAQVTLQHNYRGPISKKADEL
jgi:PhoH-like ATPase